MSVTPSDNEAIKAGTKEAVTEWLETTQGREAITAGVKSALLDWFELSATGQAQIPWAAERAVTAWLDGNKGALARAISEVRR